MSSERDCTASTHFAKVENTKQKGFGNTRFCNRALRYHKTMLFLLAILSQHVMRHIGLTHATFLQLSATLLAVVTKRSVDIILET